VLEGTSLVDESMVTGEPIPIEKITGSKVIAATLNGTSSFLMRVEKEQGETLLAKIVQLVSDAQRTKAPIQKLADLISSYFVPLVILAAIATFVVWFIFGPEPRLNHAIINAVAVLIIACPCALGLATPISIMVGTALGAQRGVLIKNSESIETLEKVDTLIVDKTGTLTLGKPQVITVLTNSLLKEDELLRYAASLEIAGEHPLAQAIVMKALEKGLKLLKVEDFQTVSGKGARGHIKGQEVMVGNKRFLDEHNVDTAPFINQTGKLRE
jgi:Cu+-exporting ATPase